MKTFIHHEYPKLERKTSADGSRVYATPSGRAYPSVTTVTGLHSKQGILDWRKKVGEEAANAISTRAANRGTRIHQLCEDFLLGEHVEPDIFDQDLFKKIRTHLDRIDNIHALESPLYSDHLEVAGTVDCIAEYDGKLAVIDFKTSSKLKQRDWIHGYFMQTSAYAVMFEERTGIPIGKLVIIIGVDDEEPQIFTEKRDDWIDGFKELRLQYKQVKHI
jgi:genome maintenance exonuclease 1